MTKYEFEQKANEIIDILKSVSEKLYILGLKHAEAVDKSVKN